MPEVSTKPYLVRAIYEWCADSGFRPFIAVVVDERTQVPREFVRNGEIVLNISAEATNRLHIGNELLEFEARFSGAARHVSIPIDNVRAIFAQENGHGMAFEVPARRSESDEAPQPQAAGDIAGRTVPDDGKETETGDRGEPARAPRKRAASKRARKTVLHEVGASASSEGKAQGETDPPQAASPPAGKRPRSPSIAAVPRSGEGRGDRDPASPPGRPRGPDDPGPGTTPGKPRLKRVK
ncbi:MAG: ClpXP protease specificity-enhancing factor [Burkholderiaceae bacterium]|nr:ClpXP protease specificity-enhancing factor [Burkholderiaceae bacterium]